MSGTLFVVATPIGNLEDITLRAVRVLREAQVIAAEDTRRTARLLAHHAIATPTLSFHDHNRRARIPQILTRLRSGDDVALVTDAGTPGISDPGTELIHACVEEGFAVDPVPGASAPITAVMASGFPLNPLSIYGFVPSRAKDRTAWLEEVGRIPHTVTFFESPHRIEATLEIARVILGKRQILLARELTKIHQQFLRGTAEQIRQALKDIRGEFTLVLSPIVSVVVAAQELPADSVLAGRFGHLTDIGGCSRREAVTRLAREYGFPAKTVYAAIERGLKSGECP